MSDVQLDDRDIFMGLLSLIMMAVSVGLLIITLVLLFGQVHKNSQTYDAVCTYSKNLQQQVTDTEHYLALHPTGAPEIGLTAGYLNSTIAREKAAVDSLSGLNCPVK